MVKISKDNEYLVSLLKESVRKTSGKASEAIVDVLFGKENVSEFKIANDLKLTINQTRNILYKLSNASLLTYSRKKDEKKGWYTYFWTLNMERCLDKLLKAKQQELLTFENLFKSRSMKNFYYCPNDNIEMSEETAMGHNFFCQECGELLQILPEEKKVKEISNRIEEIKKHLGIISIELEKIRPKIIIPEKKSKKNKKEKIEKKINKSKGKENKKNKSFKKQINSVKKKIISNKKIQKNKVKKIIKKNISKSSKKKK